MLERRIGGKDAKADIRHDIRKAGRMVEQVGDKSRGTAYLGSGRSGFQDLVAAQTQLGGYSASIPRGLDAGSLQPHLSSSSDVNPERSWKDFVQKRCGRGTTGDDDVVRWDGVMPVHVRKSHKSSAE